MLPYERDRYTDWAGTTAAVLMFLAGVAMLIFLWSVTGEAATCGQGPVDRVHEWETSRDCNTCDATGCTLVYCPNAFLQKHRQLQRWTDWPECRGVMQYPLGPIESDPEQRGIEIVPFP